MSSESDRDRPDLLAFRELAQVVRLLEEELASFRRRALTAEARLKDVDAHVGGNGAGDAVALARENADLRKRLDEATRRTSALLERVRFARQQQDRGVER